MGLIQATSDWVLLLISLDFSSKASGFQVDFHYPTITALVPANIGVVNNAPNSDGAIAFIEYLLTAEGQAVLLDPAIMRLPMIQKHMQMRLKASLTFKDSSIGATS